MLPTPCVRHLRTLSLKKICAPYINNTWLFLNFRSTWINYFHSNYLISKKFNIFKWLDIIKKCGNCCWMQVKVIGWNCGDIDKCVLNFHRKTTQLPQPIRQQNTVRVSLIMVSITVGVFNSRTRVWLTSQHCPFKKKLSSIWNSCIYHTKNLQSWVTLVTIYSYAAGTSLSVMVNIDLNVAIVTSAAVTVAYTVVGQMISVAYTDIVQLALIVLGLVN